MREHKRREGVRETFRERAGQRNNERYLKPKLSPFSDFFRNSKALATSGSFHKDFPLPPRRTAGIYAADSHRRLTYSPGIGWKLPYIFFMNRLSKLLPSRSFVKQILGAGALASTSSCLSQTFIEKNDEIDYQRVLNFGLVTMAIVGPIQFHWFRFLSRFIEGTSFKTGFKRMVVDQLIAAPLLTSLFLFNIQLLESKSIDTSINRTRNVLGAVMTNNYKLWPMVQLINMSVVPLEYRIIFLQFVGLFWNCYISYMTKK
uniref:Mitochondrial inner membrane protein Mpv17 n=1 Tax=Bursaphelenchus xylophilus TaxID=6326 RepID=A0A1I7SA39_BURXY